MADYRKTFPKRHAFLAVVHAEKKEQTLRNIGIAHDNGADGVFLINHSIPATRLIEFYKEARQKYHDFWMGMNLLNMTPILAASILPTSDTGLWADNAGISDSGISRGAVEFAQHRLSSLWGGLYFGGVAFKYQAPVHDLARVTGYAKSFMDVVTTSGEGTGMAADLGKIQVMSKALDGHPLALASGTTSENVEDYMPYVDCFIVATGVSDSHTEFNPPKVRALSKKLHK